MGYRKSIVGAFGIRIDAGNTVDSAPVPENNRCQSATVLVLDQIEGGTTIGATETPDVSSKTCFDTIVPFRPNPDVWYTFVGTGANVTVSTCTGTALDFSHTFDTQLAVYTGDCETGLECIAGNDDDVRDSCEDAFLAGVSWPTELGVSYWIRVFGFDGAGKFGLKVYEGQPRVG